MDADCVHGVAWYECDRCEWPEFTIRCATCDAPIIREPRWGDRFIHADDVIRLEGLRVVSRSDYDHEATPAVIDVIIPKEIPGSS